MNWQHGASAYRRGKCKCHVCRTEHGKRYESERAKRVAQCVLIDGRWVATVAREHGTRTT